MKQLVLTTELHPFYTPYDMNFFQQDPSPIFEPRKHTKCSYAKQNRIAKQRKKQR